MMMMMIIMMIVIIIIIIIIILSSILVRYNDSKWEIFGVCATIAFIERHEVINGCLKNLEFFHVGRCTPFPAGCEI